MKNQKGYTIIELVFVLAASTALLGWILNIYKLIGSDLDPLTILVILRVVGIFFAPLGALLGFL